MLLRRLLVLPLAALAVALLVLPTAAACPFCSMAGQTLTSEVNQASMVLYGTLENPKQGADLSEGTTDLAIEAVIKKHDLLQGKKVITLARYVPPDPEKKYKYVVFCDVFKGKIDPYRGMPVKADSDVVKYLEGALAVKEKPMAQRLRFFFNYLDDSDVEVSNDALKEWANADYKDYRDMARELPADKIAGWLKDPKTPSFRYGLYASLLGHCGKPEHAKVLRSMLDDPDHRLTSGMDGILAGYVLLQPKDGWEYVRGMLKDPSKEFTARYAALRTARFFHDFRPDLVSKKDVIEAVCQLLDQSDIADLAIEDLRKWQVWDVADKVLALAGKESHDIPIIKRSILRYALGCPGPKAAAFVADRRKQDPEAVTNAEELLKLETSAPAPAQPAAARSK
jgi:hypothetical protein